MTTVSGYSSRRFASSEEVSLSSNGAYFYMALATVFAGCAIVGVMVAGITGVIGFRVFFAGITLTMLASMLALAPRVIFKSSASMVPYMGLILLVGLIAGVSFFQDSWDWAHIKLNLKGINWKFSTFSLQDRLKLLHDMEKIELLTWMREIRYPGLYTYEELLELSKKGVTNVVNEASVASGDVGADMDVDRAIFYNAMRMMLMLMSVYGVYSAAARKSLGFLYLRAKGEQHYAERQGKRDTSDINAQVKVDWTTGLFSVFSAIDVVGFLVTGELLYCNIARTSDIVGESLKTVIIISGMFVVAFLVWLRCMRDKWLEYGANARRAAGNQVGDFSYGATDNLAIINYIHSERRLLLFGAVVIRVMMVLMKGTDWMDVVTLFLAAWQAWEIAKQRWDASTHHRIIVLAPALFGLYFTTGIFLLIMGFDRWMNRRATVQQSVYNVGAISVTRAVNLAA